MVVEVVLFEEAPYTVRLGLIALAAVLAATFLALVVAHGRSRDEERRLAMHIRLCDDGLGRIHREWDDLPALGSAPADGHPYVDDLDLFAHASVSKLLGSVGTTPGRQTLRRWLLEPSPPGEARRRQPAVTELATDHDLRETLGAWGRLVGAPTPQSLETFLDWAESEGTTLPGWAVAAAYVLPVATATLVLGSWQGWLDGPWWMFPSIAALIVSLVLASRIHGMFGDSSSGEVGLAHYAQAFAPLEEAGFQAPLLQETHERLSAGGLSASRQLSRLMRLVHLADARRNPMVHWPLQILTLWDLHLARRFDAWRAVAGPHVRDWVTALGEVDALSGLGTLRFENPDWTYPTLKDEGDVVRARDLTHPYLAAGECVRNDVEVGPPGSFLLVTGSNMSGKSTLLRAIGVNVVLARAGAPVAASDMEVSPVRLETTMRVRDSLEAGVSFFMAELQSLKTVVDAARVSERAPVLYLLDEILQGTNTHERQIAARTVVRHLLDAGAIGAVTTHDLHLATAPDLEARSRPVHFQETFVQKEGGTELTFDYRLHPGLATSTNALALMELVGLGDTNGAAVLGDSATTGEETS